MIALLRSLRRGQGLFVLWLLLAAAPLSAEQRAAQPSLQAATQPNARAATQPNAQPNAQPATQAAAKERGQALWHSIAARHYGAHTQNWGVAQRRDGTLFVGNTHGLLEFDGRRWRSHKTGTHPVVLSLALDEQDRLYLGTRGQFGYMQPSASGQGDLEFIALSDALPPSMRQFSEVWQTYVSKKNRLFPDLYSSVPLSERQT